MCSRVIKFVAGAGKTEYSKKYMREHKNGLYLAFNHSVVDSTLSAGLLAKTIDSFFQSFIIPKFTSQIPIIADGAEVKYLDIESIPLAYIGVGNIHVRDNGIIEYQNTDTGFSLQIPNESIHNSVGKYSSYIRYIFGQDELRLNDQLRQELATYLLTKYPEWIVHFVSNRFSYVIIDEAQDLRGYRELFVKLLFDNGMDLLVIGDDFQNINGGGCWFTSLIPDETQNTSFRCAEGVCKWVRDNLSIDIIGNKREGQYKRIDMSEITLYDDGKRTLLYNAKNSLVLKSIVEKWEGPSMTVKAAKGTTIDNDVVIIGKQLNTKALYTAITRTTKNVYSTIESWN